MRSVLQTSPASFRGHEPEKNCSDPKSQRRRIKHKTSSSLYLALAFAFPFALAFALALGFVCLAFLGFLAVLAFASFLALGFLKMAFLARSNLSHAHSARGHFKGNHQVKAAELLFVCLGLFVLLHFVLVFCLTSGSFVRPVTVRRSYHALSSAARCS